MYKFRLSFLGKASRLTAEQHIFTHVAYLVFPSRAAAKHQFLVILIRLRTNQIKNVSLESQKVSVQTWRRSADSQKVLLAFLADWTESRGNSNLISFGSDPLKVPVNDHGELFPNTEKLEEAKWNAASGKVFRNQILADIKHCSMWGPVNDTGSCYRISNHPSAGVSVQLKRRLCHVTLLYVMYVVQQLREQCVHRIPVDR